VNVDGVISAKHGVERHRDVGERAFRRYRLVCLPGDLTGRSGEVSQRDNYVAQLNAVTRVNMGGTSGCNRLRNRRRILGDGTWVCRGHCREECKCKSCNNTCMPAGGHGNLLIHVRIEPRLGSGKCRIVNDPISTWRRMVVPPGSGQGIPWR
jgi:hypothetical protein